MTIKNKGILIVDDMAQQRQFIKDILVGDGYKTIFEAGSGTECLKTLFTHEDEIFVLILDLLMPNMDGFQVIQHVSQNHPVNTAIVVITAYIDETALEKNQVDSITGISVLTKPIDIPRFLDAINSAITSVIQRRQAFVATGTKELIENYKAINAQIKGINSLELISVLRSVDQRLSRNETVISNLEQRTDERLTGLIKSHSSGRNFLMNLGLDLLRTIIIGLAILLMLKFGLSDFLKTLVDFK